MDNRRKNYRHLFQPDERIHVELEGPSRQLLGPGEVLDLCVEGIRVHLGGSITLAPQDQVVVRLPLPGTASPLSLASVVVYLQKTADGWECGLRFLPLVDPAGQAARDRVLCGYVMAEQRRSIRKCREEPVKLRTVS